MPEITEKDIKWLRSVDDISYSRLWSANLDLDGKIDQWAVCKNHNNTAIFVQRGTYSENEGYVPDVTLQEILNRYPGEGIICVNAKSLRKAIRSIKPKEERYSRSRVAIETQPADHTITLTGWLDNDPGKELMIPVSLLHPVSLKFEINPRLWLKALAGFEGDIWILVKPCGGSTTYQITNNGDRMAFITGFNQLGEELQYRTFNRSFWEKSVREALCTNHTSRMAMSYGEVVDLSSTAELEPYWNCQYDPAAAAYELLTAANAAILEEISKIDVGTAVSYVLDIDKTKTYTVLAIEDTNPRGWVELQDHYPVMRDSLRLVK